MELPKKPLMTSLKALYENPHCSILIYKMAAYRGVSRMYASDDDTPFPISDILESNGIQGMLMVIEHCVPDGVKLLRLIAADIAELVLPLFEAEYPNDDRPRKAIEAARNFDLSSDELRASHDAAWKASVAAAAPRAGREDWECLAFEAARAASVAAIVDLMLMQPPTYFVNYPYSLASRVADHAISVIDSCYHIKAIIKKYIGEEIESIKSDGIIVVSAMINLSSGDDYADIEVLPISCNQIDCQILLDEISGVFNKFKNRNDQINLDDDTIPAICYEGPSGWFIGGCLAALALATACIWIWG